jgi:hypothetical protein
VVVVAAKKEYCDLSFINLAQHLQQQYYKENVQKKRSTHKKAVVGDSQTHQDTKVSGGCCSHEELMRFELRNFGSASATTIL